MRTLIRPALMLLAFLTLVTGLAYPLLVTVMGQALFPDKANGSLLFHDGKTVGSALIGQNFTEPKYFWGRLSATGSFPYNAMASGGSNYGAMHPALLQATQDRINALRSADSSSGEIVSTERIIPADLGTASGSGLDPDISVAAAEYQAARIAKARGLTAGQVLDVIHTHVQGKFLGFSGMPRVNVLRLNIALDAITKA